MTDKQTYIDKQQAQLDEWQAKIDLLKAKARKVQADTREDLENSIRQIEAARDTVTQRINDMRQSKGSTWENVKSDVESAVDNLKQAVTRLTGSR